MLAVGVAGTLVLSDPARGQDAPPPPEANEAAPPGGIPVAPPPAEAPALEGEAPLGEEEAMVLNFERADIREVIHSLATALGISYTIDPRIEGQVTIRTTGKIAREDLFPLLNQILRNNGIAAVKVGDVYQVLPVAEAKTRAIIPSRPVDRETARANDGFVIEILSLKHLSSDEMANILTPFVTPGGDVLSYPRANVLVVTDLQSNVGRLRELAATFDTNVFRDLHARVFKIQHGDPEELANEVLGLLAPYGVTATGEGEGGTFVIPLLRLNSIVVIASEPGIFAEFGRWLRMLDIPPEESAGRQTFVYNVENAKAADLAAVLNELFGGGPGGGGGGVGGRVPGAAPAGVGLFGAGGVSGGAGRAGGRGRSGLGGGGAGMGGGGVGSAGIGQQVGGAGGAGGLGGGAGRGGGGGGRLGGGRGGAGGLGAVGGVAGAGGVGAGGVAGAAGARGVSLPGGAAGGAPGGPQGPPPIFKQEVRIVADDVTNSLIILATRRDFQLILDVLKRIDVMPRQVVLEVTIAEIQLRNEMRFGISWALAGGNLNMTQPSGGGDNLFGGMGANTVGLPVGGLIGEAMRVPAGGAFAVISDREHFNLFINTVAAKTNVKFLSAPHIIAADNREAHILIGQSIPILTSTQTSTGIQGTVGAQIGTVQYRDTGKILTVLPQVNSKGLVNLQIRQEVSSVVEGQASFGNTNSPAFNTREAETTAVVQDGESILIGGIIDDNVAHRRSGVPYLMDIPVLGRIFRSEGDVVDRTELIILITPYVIRSRDEARDVSDTFADRVKGLNRLRRVLLPKRHLRAPSETGPSVLEPGRSTAPVRDQPAPLEGAVPPEAVP
jgi:general secretion pathway protein D